MSSTAGPLVKSPPDRARRSRPDRRASGRSMRRAGATVTRWSVARSSRLEVQTDTRGPAVPPPTGAATAPTRPRGHGAVVQRRCRGSTSRARRRVPSMPATVIAAHGSGPGASRCTADAGQNGSTVLPVRAEVVVALDPVLDHHLPVPCGLEGPWTRRSRARPIATARGGRRGPASVVERLRRVTGRVHQDEALPHDVAQRRRGTRRRDRPRRRTARRRASRRSGTPTGGTGRSARRRDRDRRRRPATPRWGHTLASTRTSVVGAAHQQHRLVADRRREVVTRVRHLVEPADRQPRTPRSTSAHLGREHRRIDRIGRRRGDACTPIGRSVNASAARWALARSSATLTPLRIRGGAAIGLVRLRRGWRGAACGSSRVRRLECRPRSSTHHGPTSSSGTARDVTTDERGRAGTPTGEYGQMCTSATRRTCSTTRGPTDGTGTDVGPHGDNGGELRTSSIGRSSPTVTASVASHVRTWSSSTRAAPTRAHAVQPAADQTARTTKAKDGDCG